jgi:hypothetical protein
LEIDFRSPAKPGHFFCVLANVIKRDGRKTWVQGRLVMLCDGMVAIAQAIGLFIESTT